VNPIFGKVADAYGRNTILPLGNLSVVLIRWLVVLFPFRKFPHVLDQIITIPLTTSFFAMYRAVLGDYLEAASFARANAKIGMAAGVALVAGPLVTKAIMSRTDPKYCFAASVFFALGSLLNLFFNMEESLPIEGRQPLVLSDMQPFSFLQLMTRTRALNRLMQVSGWQTFTEPRNVKDILPSYLQNELNWSWSQINNFFSAYGASLVVSGVTVKSLLNKFGLINFTTFSNMCNALSYVFMARFPPLHFLPTSLCLYAAVLFGAPGGRKRDAAESLVMKLGNQEGFGNGFISGSMMNFRAIVNVLSPPVQGYLYAWGRKKKFPNLVMLFSVLTILVSEAWLRSLSKEELGVDEKGHEIGQTKKIASSTANSNKSS